MKKDWVVHKFLGHHSGIQIHFTAHSHAMSHNHQTVLGHDSEITVDREQGRVVHCICDLGDLVGRVGVEIVLPHNTHIVFVFCGRLHDRSLDKTFVSWVVRRLFSPSELPKAGETAGIGEGIADVVSVGG